MRPYPRAWAVLAVLAVAGMLFVLAPFPGARAAAASPVSGTVTGPDVAATGASVPISINATGGPGMPVNGSKAGNLTYYATVEGSDLSGVQITPAQSQIFPGVPHVANLTVGATPETLTISVEVSSVSGSLNASINLTKTVTVVVPYVVRAVLVNNGAVTVLSFPVTVSLDGVPVATVKVPSLSPGAEYNLSYSYATLGLSAGDHTFTLAIGGARGMVTFANGLSSYSETFYVAGPSPNYTLWYALGIVAFVGVLFIFATRVAARRRGAVRK